MKYESNIVASAATVAIVERAEFLAGLEMLCRVVERRAYVPILQNVRFCGTAQGLVLSATDMDMEAHFLVPGTADSRMRVTVPAFALRDWIKSVDGGSVMIECPERESFTDDDGNSYDSFGDGRVRFTCDGASTELQPLPVTDWPEAMTLESPLSFTMTRHDFNAGLQAVAFAMSKEETRYYLRGVFWHFDRDALHLVTTDGHRLAKHTMPMPAATGKAPEYGAILPAKAVAFLEWATRDVRKAARFGIGESVRVYFTDSKACFSSRNFLVRSKLIDGTFPDYNRVIPADNDRRMTVDAGKLAKAVATVAKVSSERGRAVKLAIGDGICALAVNNPESGSATASVPVEYEGEPLEIGFNSQYLVEMLKKAGKGNVTMELQDAGSPARFVCEDSATCMVLMPMRV